MDEVSRSPQASVAKQRTNRVSIGEILSLNDYTYPGCLHDLHQIVEVVSEKPFGLSNFDLSGVSIHLLIVSSMYLA
ncbi:hypothetical protein LPU83_pLPU83d_1068 (plasmid) [Rhizobium favelukesii]|uniref:Uncharacterized protein n=1 Tax=Rhizobium favelukesii TaxID=348824 RepID=W6RUW5_9HYPH|nr:hypothetical protein LPU83_pLPU83d_1068 [Rhizobium favelukesii]